MQKKSYSTRAERLQFSLPQNLKDILVGLALGDLFINKQKKGVNVRLEFTQGLLHIEYIQHLFELFIDYCGMGPQTPSVSPDKRTGKIYGVVRFTTFTLPCFNELYNLFYVDGKKIVPSNIGELLTLHGLAYWICDDGSFEKKTRGVILNTQGFTKEEVELLAKTLNDKWDLKCTLNHSRDAFIIRISTKALPVLQNLLAPIMPSMMLHKIGL